MLLKFIFQLIVWLGILLLHPSQAAQLAQRSVLVAEPLVFTIADRVDRGADGVFSQPLTTKLPEAWNAIGKSGRSDYRLTFDVSNSISAPLAIYIPRLGNRFAVILNGKPLAHSALFGDIAADSAQRPYFLKLPAELITPTHNVIEIQLEGEKNRYAGLSTVHVGAEQEIYKRYLWRYSIQTAGSFAVMVASIVFAGLSLLFWRATKDKSYILFTLVCALWSIRTSYAIVERAPFEYHWWTFLIDICYAGVVSCIVIFCIHTLSLKFKKTLYVITFCFFATSLVLVSWHAFGEVNAVRQWWAFLMLVFVALMSVMVISAWFFNRHPASTALAGAGGMALMLGAYDHMTVFYSKDGYGSFALTRYAILFFLVAMGWILADRFLKLLTREKILRVEVSEELRIKKADLEKEHLEKEALLSESAHHSERRRLLQDLHDGMGLQLNGLMGLVENGDLNRGELTSEVRTTLEQLRVMMDGTESFDGTLAELLGHIRYRVETRLSRHAIGFSWLGTTDSITQTKVNPSSALNLQRVMFELCTNIIKHAKASQVNVDIQILDKLESGDQLRIVVMDDGVGLSPHAQTSASTASTGAGMMSVKRRVDELNASYELTTKAPRGTQHVLLIPLTSFG